MTTKKRYRVMVCDLYIDIDSPSEEEAKVMVMERIMDGTNVLSMIAWELDDNDGQDSKCPGVVLDEISLQCAERLTGR